MANKDIISKWVFRYLTADIASLLLKLEIDEGALTNFCLYHRTRQHIHISIKYNAQPTCGFDI